MRATQVGMGSVGEWRREKAIASRIHTQTVSKTANAAMWIMESNNMSLEIITRWGISVEKHGAPLCTQIEKNPTKRYKEKPQAWEENGIWKYNQLAMEMEHRFCNRKLIGDASWPEFYFDYNDKQRNERRNDLFSPYFYDQMKAQPTGYEIIRSLNSGVWTHRIGEDYIENNASIWWNHWGRLICVTKDARKFWAQNDAFQIIKQDDFIPQDNSEGYGLFFLI